MEIISLITSTAISVVVIIAAIVALTKIYSYFKNNIQGYPNEEKIEEAILPFVHKSIFAAYRASEWALDKFGKQLSGIDKKAIAKSLYVVLPNVIVVGGICILVRQAISPTQFAAIVQRAFDEFLEFYEENEEGFTELVELWLKENE